MTHTYNITGMTCNSCVAKVKSELLKLGDIATVEVQLQSPQAIITMQKHISTADLQVAVSKAGSYKITEADAEHIVHRNNKDNNEQQSSDSYFPIFLIFGFITGISLILQFSNRGFNWMQCMSHFMAGFFLVFSFFKLMNLKGFAEGYRTYDVIAKTIPVYGFIYPFIELTLGIAFLTGFEPKLTNIATLVVMGMTTIGVVQSLLKKVQFQCACLGTTIKLPLSKVTLFEDLLMVGMSTFMLIKML